MDAVTRRAMSPYFLRQLEYYGVDPAALAGPVHAGLALSGDPAQSDLAPQSVGPRQAAVFALSALTLGPGQRLLVSGRAGQRVVLVLASLSMADDARLVLTANTDLVVDQWCPGAAPGGTRVVLLTAPDGQAGPAGSRGATGVNGVDSHTPGGPGTFGGAGGNGSRGLDSPDALITIAPRLSMRPPTPASITLPPDLANSTYVDVLTQKNWTFTDKIDLGEVKLALLKRR